MFKIIVLAALATIAVAQIPFGAINPLGLNNGLFNPYNPYLGNYYNNGLFGGNYYNGGLLGGRGLFNNYYGAYSGLPGLRPPVIPPIARRPSIIPPIVRPAVVAPAVIPPVVRAPIVRAPIAATAEGAARIISQSNDATPEGAYQYQYQTENGIVAAEQNNPKINPSTGDVVNTVQGSYSYVAPNGEQITVSYVADENGFQPQLQDGSVKVARVAPVPIRARARVTKKN